MSKNIRARKEKLYWETGGICHWCGIQTVLPRRGKTTAVHPTMATLDHLRTRLDPDRGYKDAAFVDNREWTVLSCFACNHIRGVMQELAGSSFPKGFCVKVGQWCTCERVDDDAA